MQGLDFAVGTARCETSQGPRTSEDDFILYSESSHASLAWSIQCEARDRREVLTQGQNWKSKPSFKLKWKKTRTGARKI